MILTTGTLLCKSFLFMKNYKISHSEKYMSTKIDPTKNMAAMSYYLFVHYVNYTSS